MSWTDERVELLKSSWAEGLSASQIAAQLGDPVTRNSVIGKVHRLGLPGRTIVSQARAAQLQAKRTRRERRESTLRHITARTPKVAKAIARAGGVEAWVAAKLEAPPAPYVDPTPQPIDIARKALADLEDGDCRYPVGDPKKPEFGFCGCPATPAGPYCAAHAAVAFVPRDPNRQRERPRAGLAPGRSLMMTAGGADSSR